MWLGLWQTYCQGFSLVNTLVALMSTPARFPWGTFSRRGHEMLRKFPAFHLFHHHKDEILRSHCVDGARQSAVFHCEKVFDGGEPAQYSIPLAFGYFVAVCVQHGDCLGLVVSVIQDTFICFPVHCLTFPAVVRVSPPSGFPGQPWVFASRHSPATT